MRRSALRYLIVLLSAMLSGQGYCADVGTIGDGDMDSIVHVLDFLEGVPRAGRISIGIVYDEADGSHADGAQETAARLSSEASRPPRPIDLIAVSIDGLFDASRNFRALIVLPGIGQRDADAARKLEAAHLPLISTDARCLATNTCALLIQSVPRVNVVLNTAVAEATGTRLPPIFALMVKRQ